MDPAYYDRQAEAQLKKIAAETKRRADFEKAAADLDARALRDEEAAGRASSPSTARSKLRSAEGYRRRATEQRNKAAVWLAEALGIWGIEVFVVELDDEVRRGLRTAQTRQIMVNPPLDPSASEGAGVAPVRWTD
jgi:hypothetical protein